MKIKIKSYSISISTGPLEIFDSFVQDAKDKKEAGGIILGQVAGSNVYVTKASVPNTFDRAGRHRFLRDKKAAQIIVDYEFFNSNRKTIYLGEWHTHPENSPTPSKTDLKMLKQQFKDNKINEKYLLLVIRGLKDLYVALYDGQDFKSKLIDLNYYQNQK